MSASGKTREYDSSEDEDGDEFEETGDLQLCVPGEYVDESSSGAEDAYTTKCGGMPAWLVATGAARPNCGVCGKPLWLVTQVYAPEEFERTVYVFACNNFKCNNAKGSWRVLRVQSSKRAETDSQFEGSSSSSSKGKSAPATPAGAGGTGAGSAGLGLLASPAGGSGSKGGGGTAAPIGGGLFGSAASAAWDDDAAGDAAAFGGSAGAFGGASAGFGSSTPAKAGAASTGGDQSLEELLAMRDLQISAKKEAAPKTPAKAASSSGTTTSTSSSKPVAASSESKQKAAASAPGERKDAEPRQYFRPFYLSWQSEPAATRRELSKAERELAAQYEKTGSSSSDSKAAASDDEEETFASEAYEATQDKVFKRFQLRLARAPTQYEFGGTPLRVTELPQQHAAGGEAKGDSKGGASTAAAGDYPPVPKCTCGSARVFEMQLTPNLLNEIDPDEAAGGGARGMDWTAVDIWVCPKSCQADKYADEHAVVFQVDQLRD